MGLRGLGKPRRASKMSDSMFKGGLRFPCCYLVRIHDIFGLCRGCTKFSMIDRDAHNILGNRCLHLTRSAWFGDNCRQNEDLQVVDSTWCRMAVTGRALVSGTFPRTEGMPRKANGCVHNVVEEFIVASAKIAFVAIGLLQRRRQPAAATTDTATGQLVCRSSK